MPHQRLDQIRSKLTGQDEQTLRMSVGIDLGSFQLNPEVFTAFEQRRAQARDALVEAPSRAGAKRGLRCSFCQKYVTEITYIMKLSDAHVMCDLCIDNLVDVLKEGA